MREMQRREQGRLVAGVQRLYKAVEHCECLVDRRLVRLGLSLVDSDRPSPLGGYFFAARTARKALPDGSVEDTHIITAGDPTLSRPRPTYKTYHGCLS